jgi:hypothetical protein
MATLSACAPTRPTFVEPSWGDAPPPQPEQIAEITLDRNQCGEKCRSTRIKLRRDGQAELQYLTRSREDSLFYADIDSATFRQLARQLVLDSLFEGEGAEPGQIEPFATSGTVVSASILCRRFVDQWDERRVSAASRPARIMAAIDAVIRHLTWRRCCEA